MGEVIGKDLLYKKGFSMWKEKAVREIKRGSRSKRDGTTEGASHKERLQTVDRQVMQKC